MSMLHLVQTKRHLWGSFPSPLTWELSLFLLCCFPLPPANRQLAALLWQQWELPDTLVTAWLVSGRFSTLTLEVWRAANVLEGATDRGKVIIMSTSLPAWAELNLTVSCRLGPDRPLSHNSNSGLFLSPMHCPLDQAVHYVHMVSKNRICVQVVFWILKYCNYKLFLVKDECFHPPAFQELVVVMSIYHKHRYLLISVNK